MINIENDVKPFIKWAGGKRRLLPILLSHLPDKIDHYFELFVGGGALLFELLKQQKARTYAINDLNQDLITTYEVVATQCDALIEALNHYADKHDKAFYYSMRDSTPQTDVETAAKFIYLNKTCFNGLYRVNSSGKFNVPIGRYKNPCINDVVTLKACSALLKPVVINCRSYAAYIPKKGGTSFVYLDPPYDETYTGYTKGQFDKQEQTKLKEYCDTLNKRGVKFMVSNSATPYIQNLYSNYNVKLIKAPRSINSNGNDRSDVMEVLVRNYE